MSNSIGRKLLLIGGIGGMAIAVALGQLPKFSKSQSKGPPPKIIRACCQFGSDVAMVGIPFRKVSAITAPKLLGEHVYLGDKRENNGIIYTHLGGFIDLGHLRDMADWTAYLYAQLQKSRDSMYYIFPLGREGGRKRLFFFPSPELTDTDLLRIAGHIAFDLSVWHEVSTWFGVSYIPFLPERYSSFSPEDIYSNALGVRLGMEAIRSTAPYSAAMTRLLDSCLVALEAVEDIEQTKEAMDRVEGLWWTREEKLPRAGLLIRRYYDAYMPLRPWLIEEESHRAPHILTLNTLTQGGRNLTDYYSLRFYTDYRIPIQQIFPKREKNILTNTDLVDVIRWIERDASL